MTARICVLVLAVALGCTGCAPSTPTVGIQPVPWVGVTDPAPSPASAESLPVGDPASPMPAPNTCHIGSKNGAPMPDPHCTPGAVNPGVTPGTLGATICRKGWTATIRPATGVTSRWKRLSQASYGVTGTTGEYDHLVSLELGGAPLDPRNLWPEPGSVPNPKDKVENALKSAVCSGRVSLSAAQRAISVSWPTALVDLGVK
jgi:hypothetical protein